MQASLNFIRGVYLLTDKNLLKILIKKISFSYSNELENTPVCISLKCN